MSNADIRARLVEARKRRGMTRPQAAEIMDLDYQTYAGHENGHSSNGDGLFSVASAIRYAKLYGVSLDWLLTGKEGGAAEVTERKEPVVTSFLRWRRHRFLRARHAAKLFGLPHEEFARIESGASQPTEAVRQRMCEVYDCTPEELRDPPPRHTPDVVDFIDKCLLTDEAEAA